MGNDRVDEESVRSVVPALRAYDFLVSWRWRLDPKIAAGLLGIDELTFRGWMGLARSGLPVLLAPGARETLTARLRMLFDLAAQLDLLFPNDADASDAWVRTPNTATMFGGESPCEYMVAGGGSSITRVRDHVVRLEGELD